MDGPWARGWTRIGPGRSARPEISRPELRPSLEMSGQIRFKRAHLPFFLFPSGWTVRLSRKSSRSLSRYKTLCAWTLMKRGPRRVFDGGDLLSGAQSCGFMLRLLASEFCQVRRICHHAPLG
jgi:hypothetical protein